MESPRTYQSGMSSAQTDFLGLGAVELALQRERIGLPSNAPRATTPRPYEGGLDVAPPYRPRDCASQAAPRSPQPHVMQYFEDTRVVACAQENSAPPRALASFWSAIRLIFFSRLPSRLKTRRPFSSLLSHNANPPKHKPLISISLFFLFIPHISSRHFVFPWSFL
ncbi:hypothetical protein M440DRAFT_116951 [Trichoderma longibrachiatum ATCC 18648]|uniref:Uncharacterized protein n=1 Tax=Trichoderma longibrachiatum ATCC 18648 TaxID=983965 RepID=A0A2T4BYN5_TRILO|nr:hypothetical protein M440DRAFT_116951 [Trichoderma longibrachiatum ATCC 18648]